ncbi:unnamed protein product [Rotaria sp. Silwood1]|nr:unnamed protein product [Rotaria sp. Silwood1]
MGNRLGVSKSKHGRSSLMQKFDSHDADTASGYAENSSLVRMVSTMHDTNLETFMLVWLDPRIDTDRGYIEMQKRLKDAFTCCIVFDDNNKCEQWLKRSTDDDRLVLVVSGAFGQMIVPKVHDMKQIVDIYVYCRNKSRHQRWTKTFRRILKDQKNRENIEDSRALSIIDQNKLASNTTSIEDAFIWYELLLDVLFNHIPSTSTFDDLIKILLEYSSDNEEGLLQIDEFKKSYESRKALLYIINDTPLARFVNKALRNQDIYMIFALRFLLTDIRQQLINHRQQSVHVFKWHIMSKMQLDSVSSKPGQILMINGFLFTTKRLNNELCPEKPSQDSEIVLFDIDAIYQNETSTPFADIGDIDQCQHRNDEIIFMCGSMFGIENIYLDRTLNTWRLHLKLVNELNIPALRKIKQQLKDAQDLSIVGKLMYRYNQQEKALAMLNCTQLNKIYVFCMLRNHCNFVRQYFHRFPEKLGKVFMYEKLEYELILFGVDFCTRLADNDENENRALADRYLNDAEQLARRLVEYYQSRIQGTNIQLGQQPAAPQ